MFPSLEQAWQQSEADEERKWGDPKFREARNGLALAVWPGRDPGQLQKGALGSREAYPGGSCHEVLIWASLGR